MKISRLGITGNNITKIKGGKFKNLMDVISLLMTRFGLFSPREDKMKKYTEKEERDRELFHAVHDKDPEKVRLSMKKGADVNAINNIEWTPLMVASNNGCLEIVKILVEAGADTDTVEGYGRTAARLAFNANHIGIKNYLENLKKPNLILSD